MTRPPRADGSLPSGPSAELLLESCPDGFVAIDAAWRITYVNAAAERLNGVRRVDLLGRDHWEAYPATVGTAVDDGYRRVMAERAPLRIENYYQPWGRWFELDAFPTPDGGIAAYYRDVTGRKREEEERRRRQADLTDFVENAAVGLHWVGPDGVILWANKAELDLLGYTREEYVGRNVAEFHADPAVIRDILCRLTGGEVLHSCEARLRCKDGTVRHVLISSNVCREDGEFRHTRCFTRDVTERKRGQIVAAGQKDAFEKALGGAPLPDVLDVLARTARDLFDPETRAAVLVADAGGRLRFAASAGMAEAYGRAIDGCRVGPDAPSCARAAFTGKEVIDADVEHAPSWAALRGLAREHGIGACWSLPITTPGGRVFGTVAAYHPAPRRPAASELEHLRLLGRTAAVVMERYEEAESRRAAEEAVREASRRKDEFLATLAHELRNPLAPLRTGLGVLRLEPLGGTAGPVVETMERQVVHLVRLVDDLLDVSRVTRGRVTLRPETLDLRAAVESAVETCRPAIDGARHHVSVRIPERPVFVDADRVRLAQVVTNVLGNACKYTPEGGEIDVAVAVEGGGAVVRVRDTGIGIPAEMLTKVFDTFTQVDPGLARSQGGLGIGLSLAKRLVELHGGEILAESGGPGRGSTFTIRLPVAAASDGDVSPAAPPRIQERPPAPRRRVLVVDDLAASADLLAMMLRRLGQTAEAAYDGEAALRLADEFRPDVVLSDIGMPGMDGYELAERLRRRGPDRPFLVAVTGYGQEEDVARALSAGFDAHMVKPVGVDAVRGLLASVPESFTEQPTEA